MYNIYSFRNDTATLVVVVLILLFLPARNKVLAKVIFSQASVIHSVHRGGGGVSGPGGFSNFSEGGFLQIFGGAPILGGGLVPGGSSKFSGGFSNFSGGGVLHRNTVNVRPVRILLNAFLFTHAFIMD